MPEKRPLVYRLTIETLSPLHIGTGQILRRGYDFAVQRDSTWVINAEALAAEMYEAGGGAWNKMLNGIPADQLLEPRDYVEGSPLFRYVLRGAPSSQKTGSEVRELIKDSWDRPYIPGSSLKGALRTAFAYALFEQRGEPFTANSVLDGKPKTAAQQLERSLLSPRETRGKSPNYDIFRVVRVGDSTPADTNTMRLVNAAVVKGKGVDIPIPLECVAVGVTFNAVLSLDTALLDQHEQMGWKAKPDVSLVKRLSRCVNFLSNRRISDEAAYWEARNKRLYAFYRTLAEQAAAAPKHTCYLQLGWGGGWSSKTFGDHITSQPREFYRVVRTYQKFMDRQNSYREGDPYPKTRRVIVRDGQPLAPLGWIKVTMEEVQR